MLLCIRPVEWFRRRLETRCVILACGIVEEIGLASRSHTKFPDRAHVLRHLSAMRHAAEPSGLRGRM